MKKYNSIILLLFAFITMILSGCSSNNVNNTNGSSNTNTSNITTAHIQTIKNNPSTLIVYYSYSGTTKRVAEHLQSITGGDLYEITLAKPYGGSDNDVSDRVFDERNHNEMPKLSGALPDVSKYDRILIGTPVWNDSMANPIMTFLEETDFSGKVVAPFWTYITSQGHTEKDFSKQIQNGNVKNCLPLRSANSIADDKLDSTIVNWLNTL